MFYLSKNTSNQFSSSKFQCRIFLLFSGHCANLTLNTQDIKSAESGLRGHKSKLFVCRCLANLYTSPAKIDFKSSNNTEEISWNLKFTGIPVLIHDMGNTKSRNKRQIQICLVEKGSGFVLWKDIVGML